MTTIAGLDALREKAGVQEKSDALNRFRADFQLVWKDWMASRHETAEAYAEAGENVRKNMADPGWMACAAAHFAQMAAAIRRDLSRSERIRSEVRASRLIDAEDAMRGVMG